MGDLVIALEPEHCTIAIASFKGQVQRRLSDELPQEVGIATGPVQPADDYGSFLQAAGNIPESADHLQATVVHKADAVTGIFKFGQNMG